MKKLLFMLVCFFLFSGLIFIRGGNVIDFTEDASCEGAWYLNGTDNETDRGPDGITLTETCSTTCDVQRGTTVPSGWSGYSRSWLEADSESLNVADGSSGGLDVSGADAEITISAYVQMYDGVALDEYFTLVGKYDSSPANRQYLLRLHGTGTNEFEVQFIVSSDCDSSGSASMDSDTTTYATATWYHIAAVYDDTNMIIYVNGVEDGTQAESDGICATGTTGAPFKLGTWGSDSEYYNHLNGRMTEVAVFSRALEEHEIKSLYLHGVDGTKGAND